MRDLQERRAVRHIMGSRIIFFILLFIAGWLAMGVKEAYKEAKEARAQKETAEAQAARLEARHQELERTLEGFSYGRGIEQEAREKLFLKKPEEEVVIIVE